MAVRERKRSTVAAVLAALVEAGDNRAAAARARRVLADGSGSPADQDAARATLARVAPDRTGILMVAFGSLLLAAAALLGLSAA